SRAPLLIAASVSTLGGLLFGYDNIVISGAIGYLTQLFHLDAAGTGWAQDALSSGASSAALLPEPGRIISVKRKVSLSAPFASLCLRPACSSPPTSISSWPGA